MNKLSIWALVISIVALAVAIYAATAGFSGGGTSVGTAVGTAATTPASTSSGDNPKDTPPFQTCSESESPNGEFLINEEGGSHCFRQMTDQNNINMGQVTVESVKDLNNDGTANQRSELMMKLDTAMTTAFNNGDRLSTADEDWLQRVCEVNQVFMLDTQWRQLKPEAQDYAMLVCK